LRKLSLRQIGTYLQQLAETDYRIKTGRTKTPVAMEQFVLKLANTGATTPPKGL
jgi:DNA polymerase III delta subunit